MFTRAYASEARCCSAFLRAVVADRHPVVAMKLRGAAHSGRAMTRCAKREKRILRCAASPACSLKRTVDRRAHFNRSDTALGIRPAHSARPPTEYSAPATLTGMYRATRA